MTYKEFTECARPELICDSCKGGVIGCPSRTQFKGGFRILGRDCLKTEMKYYNVPNVGIKQWTPTKRQGLLKYTGLSGTCPHLPI